MGVRMMFVAVMLALVFVGFAGAQEGDAAEGQEAAADPAVQEDATGGEDAPAGEMTPGLIFNASNLLLDLSEYQGGFGGKLDYGDFAVRGLFSFELESTEDAGTSDDFALTLGAAVEVPFFHGRVTPYWGGFIDGTVASEKAENTAGEESSLLVLRGSAGPILGAELYIFDFLSVFAEYLLALSVARTRRKSEATDTNTQTTNYELATSLGNGGSLGVVIYLNRKPFDETGEDMDSAETAR